MAEDVVDLARRFIDAVNRHDIDALIASLAPTYVHHSAAGDLDAAQLRAALGKYIVSFPDFRYEVVDISPMADGHSVVARWTMRGTHLAPAFGAAATGKAFASPGLSLHRFADGKAVEDWEYGDDIGMFEDLGFTLEPPAAPSEA